MHSGPSQILEAIFAALLPPACREEVLGDLHERYRSAGQYTLDALRTVPPVIASRIRRTADPQMLVIQGFVLYLSFLGAAWFRDGTFLVEQWELLRLAIPAAITLVGLVLDDAYAVRARRSPLDLARGPALGLTLAVASQEIFRIGNPDLALPRWIMFYGCATSLVFSSAVRMCFPPLTDPLQRAHASAHSVKQPGGPPGTESGDLRVLKTIFVIITVAVVGAWMFVRAASPKTQMVPVLLVLFAALYQVWKRA